MSLTIKCCMCPKELSEPGALIFSPPNGTDICKKYHLCTDCWKKIFEMITKAKDAKPLTIKELKIDTIPHFK